MKSRNRGRYRYRTRRDDAGVCVTWSVWSDRVRQEIYEAFGLMAKDRA
jgi:hypothetical protein